MVHANFWHESCEFACATAGGYYYQCRRAPWPEQVQVSQVRGDYPPVADHAAVRLVRIVARAGPSNRNDHPSLSLEGRGGWRQMRDARNATRMIRREYGGTATAVGVRARNLFSRD